VVERLLAPIVVARTELQTSCARSAAHSMASMATLNSSAGLSSAMLAIRINAANDLIRLIRRLNDSCRAMEAARCHSIGLKPSEVPHGISACATDLVVLQDSTVTFLTVTNSRQETALLGP